MISRILLTTPRFSLAGTTRFLRSSTRNYGSLRGNGEKCMNIAKNILSGAGKPLRVVKKWLPSRVPSPTFGLTAFAGCCTLGLGALVYNGVVLNESSLIHQSKNWSETIWRNIIRTYAYLFGSLALTAATTFTLSHFLRFMNSNMAIIGSAVASVIAWVLCIGVPYERTLLKHTVWIAHCASSGMFLNSLSSISLGLKAISIVRIGQILAGIIAISFVVAMTIPPNLLLKQFEPAENFNIFYFYLALGAGCLLFPLSNFIGSWFISAFIFNTLIVLPSCRAQDMILRAVDHKKVHDEKYGRVRCFDPISAQLSFYVTVMSVLSFLRLFYKFT